MSGILSEHDFLSRVHAQMQPTVSFMWRSTFEIGAAQLRLQNYGSYAWTEAPFGMVFVPAQELYGTVWIQPNFQKRVGENPWNRVERLCNISNMRRSVSLPEETLTRELRIRRAAEYFWQTSCVLSGDTVSNAFYYFSNKMILEGEINDAKMSSFSSDFQTLIKHLTFCIFFINY